MPAPNFVRSPDPTSLPTAQAPYVLSYFALRKAVGWIAIALPIAVFSIIWLRHACYQNSISAYYYTGMRNLFVGSLCAIGLFLIACVGYRDDRIPSVLAGACALLVAFCPTAVPTCSTGNDVCAPSNSTLPFPYSNAVHTSAATLLFLTLAYFCLVLFRKSAPIPTPRKLLRNSIYLVCGIVILAAMAFYAVAALVAHHRGVGAVQPRNLLFFIEAICLFAFGSAWLVKGQQILADQ